GPVRHGAVRRHDHVRDSAGHVGRRLLTPGDPAHPTRAATRRGQQARRAVPGPLGICPPAHTRLTASVNERGAARVLVPGRVNVSARDRRAAMSVRAVRVIYLAGVAATVLLWPSVAAADPS